MSLDPKPSVIIVGAGVFGLSTALYLTKRGYTNVKVLDSQIHDEKQYSPSLGSRSASADLNKIFRASYGAAIDYQNLAYEAQAVWKQWNEEMSSGDALPAGLSPGDQILNLAGLLRVSATEALSQHEQSTLENMTLKGLRDTQYSLSDAADQKRVAADPSWHKKFCTFGDPTMPDAKAKGGVLDTTAGFLLASKACVWGLELCRRAGVQFAFGKSGAVLKFIEEDAEGVKMIIGVETADEVIHKANLVIVASGAHTPLLVPSTTSILTATAGSLVTYELPRSQPDLWERFAPENFPVVIWGMRALGGLSGLYVLPRTSEGLVKFGYRGVKFTNLGNPEFSTPVYPDTVPRTSMDVVNEATMRFLPELEGLPYSSTRLCWYTDGTDDNFLVDYVPGYEGLFVATGGSGHAFKFLPVIGHHVVDALEKRETVYTRMWRWREGGRRPTNTVDLSTF